MIRRLVLIGVAVLVAAGVVVSLGAGGSGASGRRVAAEFDTADFLVKGQEVKVAGAAVGEVTAVRLTPQRTALVEMQVQKQFGPFHSDGECSIRPESLIGEKFVDCTPGTPKGKALHTGFGGLPTLPKARNHSPVDLDLVFAALRLPYRQRLTLLVNELGVGLAGRPHDLNEAIRRANPALQQANDVLAILDRDRNSLGQLIDSSDRVIGELARHDGDVQDFIARADKVAGAVADRRGDLGRAVDRLPPLLTQLEPAANDLAGLATDAQPVARQLRSAAQPVRTLFGDLGPLTDAARPTLVALNDLSRTGRRAVRSATPVAAKLAPVAHRLPELALLARELNESLKAQGFPEGLQTFLYLGTAATARFDRISHILPSYQIAGTCQQYATSPVAGCSANFAGGQKAEGGRQKADRRQKAERRRHRRRRHHAHEPSTASPPSAFPPASPPSAFPPPSVPSVPDVPLPNLGQTLDYLLGR